MDFTTPENPIARISASAARAVLHFAGVGDVRYYLNGIKIMPAKEGGALVVATDGHVLLCVRDWDGMCSRSVIVPLSKAEHARLLSNDKELWIGEDGHARIVHAVKKQVEWIQPRGEIDGKYPDITAIVGDLSQWKAGMVGAFNPNLLAKITSAVKGTKYPCIEHYHREGANENAPALVTLRIGTNPAFAVIMPMRGTVGSLESAVPAEFRSAA